MVKKLCLLVFATLLITCKKPATTFVIDYNKYKNYIYAFPKQEVFAKEVLKVVFQQPPIDSSKIGTVADPQLWKIEPHVEGELKWENTSILTFTSKEGFYNADEYTSTIAISKLFQGVPDSVRNFSFKFRIIPIQYSVEMEYPRSDPDKPGAMMLIGQIQVNQECKPEIFKEAFRIIHKPSEHLAYQILPSDIKNCFVIKIQGIQHDDTETNLVINAKELKKTDFSFLESFNIPAKDQFVVTGIKYKHSSKSIKIFFSSPLQSPQNYKGLIQLNSDSLASTFDIKSDVIEVLFNPDQSGKKNLNIDISQSIKSKDGKQLAAAKSYQLFLELEDPGVVITGLGNIVPGTDKVLLPIQARNLKAVIIEIFKIYSSNVLSAYHFGVLEDYYNLEKVGKLIHQERIELSKLNNNFESNKWINYGLDISKMISKEPGALYEIRIMFAQEDALVDCADDEVLEARQESDYDDYGDYGESSYDNRLNSGPETLKSKWRDYRYYDGYNYEHQKNPCREGYYIGRNFAKRMILASNLALMAKSSKTDGMLMAVAYNVLTGQAAQNVEVSFYDTQLQFIGKANSDKEGVAILKSARPAAYAVGYNDKDYAYLQLRTSEALSLSEFDVSGAENKDGIKTSIYCERGIWRPGDSIFLNVILQPSANALPALLPIQVKLYNSTNQLVSSQTVHKHVLHHYVIPLATKSTDQTGTYTAKIDMAGNVETEYLNVETIKPNRLKVKWAIPESHIVTPKNPNVNLNVKWLHGSPASGLRVESKCIYASGNPDFKDYKSYIFTNPEKVSNYEFEIEGFTQKDGSYELELPTLQSSTGFHKIKVQSKVVEQSGEFSSDYYSFNAKSYDTYVGMRRPSSQISEKYALGKAYSYDVVSVDINGKPVANRNISVELYTVDYQWWYEVHSSRNREYERRQANKIYNSQQITTDQQGKASVNILTPSTGAYVFLVMRDVSSGHSCGDYFYVGNPHYYSYESGDQHSTAFASVFKFETDKTEYNVGEKLVVKLPEVKQGLYFISIEKGNQVISYWTRKAASDLKEISIPVTAAMSPNAYVSISLVQSLQGEKADLPLRMYGVSSIKVNNPNARLNPVLQIPDQVRPEEDFTIQVSEQSGKEMAYTLYIVDEGLLDLTRFVTPDPYGDLNKKEALLMHTWDNYDDFLDVINLNYAQIFSVGGDAAAKILEAKSKINRFKPVVLRSGPSHLKPGQKATHTFKIQNYIGSVRTMLIANNATASGSTEKTIPVKQELMTQITFPRVIAVGDNLKVPITLFADESKVKNATINISTTGAIQAKMNTSQKVMFNNGAEQLAYFPVQSSNQIGPAKISVQANAGQYTSNAFVEIFVDNPNPVQSISKDMWIELGKSYSETFQPFGTLGSRKAYLEISAIPNLDLQKHLSYLIQYPHGCLEQIVSAAFPQLYLNNITDLDVTQAKFISENVAKAIEKLHYFQTANGSFKYWPSGSSYYDWSDIYAGHFLVEAQSNGYVVSKEVWDKWLNAQTSLANAYKVVNDGYQDARDGIAAYRLYVLALANKPNWTATNNLNARNIKNPMAKWMLAATYKLMGKEGLAKDIISNINNAENNYSWYGYYFGSYYRDEAVIALCQAEIGNKSDAAKLLANVGLFYRGGYRANTQELAWYLLAINKVYGNAAVGKQNIVYTINDEKKEIILHKSIYRETLDNVCNAPIRFSCTHAGSKPYNVSIIQSGKPDPGLSVNKSNVLSLTVSGIPNREIKQGEDFELEFYVKNNGKLGNLKHIALQSVIPAGLEIRNWRLSGNAGTNVDYQDIRDDRVCSYFDLPANSSRLIKIPVTATYAGTYFFPDSYVEAMYQPEANALVKHKPVSIVAAK